MNSIQLAQNTTNIIDEILTAESATGFNIGQTDGEFIGGNAIKVKKINTQGLGNHSRASGAPAGDVNIGWEVLALTQDRSRTFKVDEADLEESGNTTAAEIASQFARDNIIPEIDAYRMAILANKTPTGNTVTAAVPTTPDAARTAIDLGIAALVDAGVQSGIIYLTKTLGQLLGRSVTWNTPNGSTDIAQQVGSYDAFKVQVVPQSRFYTAITLLDGATSGQEAGGFTKNATTGANINFLIEGVGVSRKVVKAAKTHVLMPEYADDGMFHITPRVRHDCFVYDNKVNGLYLHAQAVS